MAVKVKYGCNRRIGIKYIVSLIRLFCNKFSDKFVFFYEL